MKYNVIVWQGDDFQAHTVIKHYVDEGCLFLIYERLPKSGVLSETVIPISQFTSFHTEDVD
ncbi:hypothetical protein SEA_SHAM_196 [Streptomyces phage Sham]|nr:hypothetical protein SEA_SHAM_196 [Streptomyces phage Sham]